MANRPGGTSEDTRESRPLLGGATDADDTEEGWMLRPDGTPETTRETGTARTLVVAQAGEESPKWPLLEMLRRGAIAGTGWTMEPVVENTEPAFDLPVVQFACWVTYVPEDASVVKVDVYRFGDLSKVSWVSYATADMTAKAPEKYEASSGTVEFEKNQEKATIEIVIRQNQDFDANLDFQVILSNPGGSVISRTMGRCRVMIIDDDTFPTNTYREEILANDTTHIGLHLLGGFIYFAIHRVPDIKRRAILTILLDQLKNLHYLFNMFLQVYMVNTVFAVQDPDSEGRLFFSKKFGGRGMTVICLAFLYVIPFGIVSLSEYYQRLNLGCGGTLRQHLKVNLFRKYLYYSMEANGSVSLQALHTAMLDGVDQVVKNGFLVVFRILQQSGMMCTVFLFLIKKNPSSVWLLFIYPVAIGIAVNLRYFKTISLKEKAHQAEVAMMTEFDGACNSIKLIKEYNYRSEIVQRFEQVAKAQKAPNRELGLYEFTTEEIMPWVTTAIVGIYMGCAGLCVLLPRDDPSHLSLGVFLATLHIFKDAGKLFDKFYIHIKDLYGVVGPLLMLVRLLNLPSDTTENLILQNQRSSDFEFMIERLPKRNVAKYDLEEQSDEVSYMSRFDDLLICLSDVALRHDKGGPLHAPLQHITVSVKQGQLVGIIGPHGTGKSTIMRMISGAVRPRKGAVFVPSYLSCLEVGNTHDHVSCLDLYENLTYGRTCRIGDVRLERLVSICKRVGIGEHMIQLLREDAEPQEQAKGEGSAKTDQLTASSSKWFEACSHTEMRLVRLVRTLVYDPEIMLVHRPIDEFDAHQAAQTMNLLREFVDNRGIEIVPEDVKNQRPHTCFFTAIKDRDGADAASDVADVIWRISADGLTVENLPRNPLRQAIVTNSGRIVKSWQRELTNKTDEVAKLKHHLYRHEKTIADLTNASNTYQDQLKATTESNRELEGYRDSRKSRSCGLTVFGTDIT